jgi:hypothetical protein
MEGSLASRSKAALGRAGSAPNAQDWRSSAVLRPALDGQADDSWLENFNTHFNTELVLVPFLAHFDHF